MKLQKGDFFLCFQKHSEGCGILAKTGSNLEKLFGATGGK